MMVDEALHFREFLRKSENGMLLLELLTPDSFQALGIFPDLRLEPQTNQGLRHNFLQIAIEFF